MKLQHEERKKSHRSLQHLLVLVSVQAVTITADQRAAMSADQSAILGEVTTGGEEEKPQVIAAPPSTGKCSGSGNNSPPEGCHVSRSDCYSR